MSDKQVKSKERVTDHGEVFTNDREIQAMVDLVAEQNEITGSTYVEPTCGNGNFISEILRRKLLIVNKNCKKYQTFWEINAFMAVSSIYGIDLLEDNVQECRERIYNIFFKEFYKPRFKKDVSERYCKAIKYVIRCNIICGNSLTFKDSEGKSLIVSEWKIIGDGMIQRQDYDYGSIVNMSDKKMTHTIDNWCDEDSNVSSKEPGLVNDTYPVTYYLDFGESGDAQ